MILLLIWYWVPVRGEECVSWTNVLGIEHLISYKPALGEIGDMLCVDSVDPDQSAIQHNLMWEIHSPLFSQWGPPLQNRYITQHAISHFRVNEGLFHCQFYLFQCFVMIACSI